MRKVLTVLLWAIFIAFFAVTLSFTAIFAFIVLPSGFVFGEFPVSFGLTITVFWIIIFSIKVKFIKKVPVVWIFVVLFGVLGFGFTKYFKSIYSAPDGVDNWELAHEYYKKVPENSFQTSLAFSYGPKNLSIRKDINFTFNEGINGRGIPAAVLKNLHRSWTKDSSNPPEDVRECFRKYSGNYSYFRGSSKIKDLSEELKAGTYVIRVDYFPYKYSEVRGSVCETSNWVPKLNGRPFYIKFGDYSIVSETLFREE